MTEDISQGERTTGKYRKVVVDRTACIGAQSCAIIAAKTFKMDGENLAYVVESLNEEDEETLLMGAQSCPVLAIKLFDEEGKQVFPEM